MDEKELLKFIQSNFPRPFLLRELAKRLRLSGDHRMALKEQVKKMVVQGKLIRIKGQRFGLPTAMNLVVGILQASSKGFGYVIPEDVRQVDVFVEGRDFGTAMHDDKVVVRVEGKNRMGKPKGRISEFWNAPMTRLSVFSITTGIFVSLFPMKNACFMIFISIARKP